LGVPVAVAWVEEEAPARLEDRLLEVCSPVDEARLGTVDAEADEPGAVDPGRRVDEVCGSVDEARLGTVDVEADEPGAVDPGRRVEGNRLLLAEDETVSTTELDGVVDATDELATLDGTVTLVLVSLAVAVKEEDDGVDNAVDDGLIAVTTGLDSVVAIRGSVRDLRRVTDELVELVDDNELATLEEGELGEPDRVVLAMLVENEEVVNLTESDVSVSVDTVDTVDTELGELIEGRLAGPVEPGITELVESEVAASEGTELANIVDVANVASVEL
jgi:hypothetical protein